MQEIIYNNKMTDVLHYYLDLYKLYSEINTIPDNIHNYIFPITFKDILETLELGLQKKYNYSFQNLNLPIYNFKSNNKKIIIAFSGGKDSTALALYYKQLGYQILLYHLHGINHTYPNELQIAQQVAKYLDLPLIEENIKLSGTNSYLEHPLKNQIICSFMVNYLIQNNLYEYELGFGDFLSDTITNSKFDRNWSDTQEMWISFCKSYLNQINLKLNIVFNTYIDTLKIISQDLHLLNLTQSCITPYRFLNSLHKHNEIKYNIKLFDHRCGSCWKDCVEYIYLTDHKILTKNELYYRHCEQILKQKYKTEIANPKNKPNKQDIYNAFLKNDII